MINSDDKELRSFLKKGLLNIPHQNLEDIVMGKVELIAQRHISVKRNLKKSWGFLISAVILFPIAYWYLYNRVNFYEITVLGKSTKPIAEVFFPAGILIFSVVILLMIDNLIKLSSKRNLGY